MQHLRTHLSQPDKHSNASQSMVTVTAAPHCAGTPPDQIGAGAVTRWEVDGLPALLEALQVEIVCKLLLSDQSSHESSVCTSLHCLQSRADWLQVLLHGHT